MTAVDKSASLQDGVQKVLNTFTAGNGPNNVPGAVAYVSDASGKQVAWAAAGVNEIGKPEPMKKDAIFWIASCSKLLIAISALQLVERGQLNLDDSIAKFLPEAGELKMLKDGSNPKKIPTVKDTLLILSGQACALFNNELAEWYAKQGLPPTAHLDSSGRDRLFTPYASEPGEEWNYGFNIDWAGMAVEVVTGKDLETYYRENIFEPLGIKDITFKPRSAGLVDRLAASHVRGENGEVTPFMQLLLPEEDQMKVIYPGAGLFATPSEYTKILVALLNKGTHPISGGTILKPESVELLRKDQFPEGGKLVQDLERSFDEVIPAVVSGRFKGCLAPGTKKNWAYGGLRMKEKHPTRGLSDDSLTWCGVQNSYWWVDFKDGTCGMVSTQMSPFPDQASENLLAAVESQVHAAYEA